MITLEVSESLTGRGLPGLDVHLVGDEGLLLKAAEESLRYAGASDEAELTIVIADDLHLQQLNRQFLGIDAPTDVLSFPAGEIDPESGRPYLGDVLISYPRAQAQAQADGHPVSDELLLLVVHGILHLLGYNHADRPGRAEMWDAQGVILSRLGCALDPP